MTNETEFLEESTKHYTLALVENDEEVPTIFLRDSFDGGVHLVTNLHHAKLFSSPDQAQEFYTKYILPNLLMGTLPPQNSYTIVTLSVTIKLLPEEKHPLDTRGTK